MKTKLDYAHEYAMKHLENSKGNIAMVSLVAFSWDYADAMQIEADKRSITGTPEAIANAGINGARSLIAGFQGKPKKIKSDWQPDFSKVPDWVSFCVLVDDNTGIYRELYCEYEPEFRAEKNNWYSVIGRSTYGLQVCNSNINHAYSLRERP